MVLLIGNYPPDRQQSMRRFGTMMLQGLNNSGIAAKLTAPRERFGKFRGAGSFVAKWLGYIDKFVLFPRQLQAALAKEKPSVVHICDHSNAMYEGWIEHVPVVVTCHDLLAVRGALGEETNCPASAQLSISQIVRGPGFSTPRRNPRLESGPFICSARRFKFAQKKSRRCPPNFCALQGEMECAPCLCRRRADAG